MNQSKSILIVEDDPDIREAISQLLELEGYHPLHAANGKEGVEMLRHASHPCLILLDLMMPVMNGWEFLEAIQQNHADIVATIPVVVTSAAGESAKELSKQAAGFVKKPIDLESLLDVVRKHCG